MMVHINDMRVMAILADATNTIAEGEVQQLLNVHDADTTEERYLHVIHSKTAKLFESATDERKKAAGEQFQLHDFGWSETLTPFRSGLLFLAINLNRSRGAHDTRPSRLQVESAEPVLYHQGTAQFHAGSQLLARDHLSGRRFRRRADRFRT